MNDELEDWFLHISPDGKRMVYIGYPAGTPTHDSRNVAIKIKLVAIKHGKVGSGEKTLIDAIGGQGTMNVNFWEPRCVSRMSSMRLCPSISSRVYDAVATEFSVSNSLPKPV